MNQPITEGFLKKRKGTQIRWADSDIWIVASIPRWADVDSRGGSRRRWVVWPPTELQPLACEHFGQPDPEFHTSAEAYDAYRFLRSLAEDRTTTLQINDRTMK